MPPPEGSKNLVLRLRSVNNIVMAPASTGRLVTRSPAVIKTAHSNRGIELRVKRMLDRAQKMVHKKLIEPKIDLAPAMCKEKIVISTEAPE